MNKPPPSPHSWLMLHEDEVATLDHSQHFLIITLGQSAPTGSTILARSLPSQCFTYHWGVHGSAQPLDGVSPDIFLQSEEQRKWHVENDHRSSPRAQPSMNGFEVHVLERLIKRHTEASLGLLKFGQELGIKVDDIVCCAWQHGLLTK